MPAKSKEQQRLFGMVRKCQKTGDCASGKIARIADDISPKVAKEFAHTKHKKFKEWLDEKHPE